MAIVRVSLIKLAWRPATLRTLLIVAALVVLIFVAIGASAAQLGGDAQVRAQLAAMLSLPEALGPVAAMVLLFSGLAGAAYGGVVAGSEWGWSTYRVALARGESRVRYVLGLFIAVAALALAAWVVLYVLGLFMTLVAATISGIGGGSPLDPALAQRHLAAIVLGWWAIAMQIAIAFAASFVTRSTVVGVALVMGLFLLENLAATLLPADLLTLAPITAGGTLVQTAGTTGISEALGKPLLITTVYLVASLAVAAAYARRTEVS